jgi:perosamine synthetase
MIPISAPLIGDEEISSVINVLKTGDLASGRYVTEFEESFRSFIGTRYGVATSSGTTALHVALLALGIKSGDIILTTSFSFIASSNAILYLQAKPVFIDIDPDTFNISVEDLIIKIKKYPNAKAILLVHLFGLPADMKRIMEIATEHNLLVIEDCAQAHGASIEGKNVGTFGHVSTFSFYPTKNMTSGEGGIVLTSDPKIKETLQLLVNHGQSERYNHILLGYNFRMTNIHAAIAIEQLKKLNNFNETRIENARYYKQFIQSSRITLPVIPDGYRHVFHQFSLIVEKERDQFTDYLVNQGVGFGIHYPTPIYSQPLYIKLGLHTSDCPVASETANRILSIPVHPALTKDQLKYIVHVINNYE